MSNPAEKLAKALKSLSDLLKSGRTAIRAKKLTRTEREMLLKNGFIQMVMKGWYIPSRPDERPGDTTPWYCAFWEFMADYANDRFEDKTSGVCHPSNQSCCMLETGVSPVN